MITAADLGRIQVQDTVQPFKEGSSSIATIGIRFPVNEQGIEMLEESPLASNQVQEIVKVYPTVVINLQTVQDFKRIATKEQFNIGFNPQLYINNNTNLPQSLFVRNLKYKFFDNNQSKDGVLNILEAKQSYCFELDSRTIKDRNIANDVYKELQRAQFQYNFFKHNYNSITFYEKKFEEDSPLPIFEEMIEKIKNNPKIPVYTIEKEFVKKKGNLSDAQIKQRFFNYPEDE